MAGDGGASGDDGAAASSDDKVLNPVSEEDGANAPTTADGFEPQPPPLWIVEQTIKAPVCVCCVSYCVAVLLSALMFGGLATGVITFELDTSPSSFSKPCLPTFPSDCSC